MDDIDYEKQPPLSTFVEQVPTMEGVTMVDTKTIEIQDIGNALAIELIFLILVLLYCITKLK